MSDIEKNLPNREVIKTPEQTGEQPEGDTETPSGFVKKLKQLGKGLKERGEKTLRMFGIDFSKKDREAANVEMEEVNREIDTVVNQAEEEITQDMIEEEYTEEEYNKMQANNDTKKDKIIATRDKTPTKRFNAEEQNISKDPSEVETVASRAKNIQDKPQTKRFFTEEEDVSEDIDTDNTREGDTISMAEYHIEHNIIEGTRKSEEEVVDPDEIGMEYEGQASPWESMSGYISKVERSDRSETRKGVEIFERMRSNLIDRAEGDSLVKKEQVGSDHLESLKLQLESDEEALRELNKEIDLQREKGDEEVDIEDIKQAERLEKEIENLEEDINNLEDQTSRGVSDLLKFDKNIEATNKNIDAEKEEIRQALKLLDRKGENFAYTLERLNEELLEEKSDTENKLNKNTARIKELQDDIDHYDQILTKDKIRPISKLSGQEDHYKERKAKKEEQLEREMLSVADLKRKSDNLTELMKMVEEMEGEAQKIQEQKNKLGEAWKAAFKEAAEEFDLGPDEITTMKKMYKDKKDEFIDEQLRKLSVGEINEIDGRKSAIEFIQENIKTDKAA